MTLQFASRADAPPSKIRAIFDKVPIVAQRRLEQELGPMINLSIGQPLPANPEVLEALANYKLTASSLGYTAAQGEPATLEAIAKLYNNYYPGLNYTTKEVTITSGASAALCNAFSLFIENPEDIVLTFEPFFATYQGQVAEWGGGRLKAIPTLQQNFRPTAEALRTALQQNPTTKVLLLNYPNNPSGVSLTKEELLSIIEVLRDYPDLAIIIDDVYRDFNFQPHQTIVDLEPTFKERCILINSAAKGLDIGEPNLRIGTIGAPAEVIRRLNTRQINGCSSVAAHSQAALRIAVDYHFSHLNDNLWLQATRKKYQENIAIAIEAFEAQGFAIPVKPEGAFYLLVSAKEYIGKTTANGKVIQSDLDFTEYFLDAGVAVVPGSGFGIESTEGYFRISCAQENPEILREAAQRVGDAVKLLHTVANTAVAQAQPSITKYPLGTFFSTAPEGLQIKNYDAPCHAHRISMTS